MYNPFFQISFKAQKVKAPLGLSPNWALISKKLELYFERKVIESSYLIGLKVYVPLPKTKTFY